MLVAIIFYSIIVNPEKPEECDEEYEQLLEEYTTLLLEEEELRIIG